VSMQHPAFMTEMISKALSKSFYKYYHFRIEVGNRNLSAS
jgi:hypothetical protein